MEYTKETTCEKKKKDQENHANLKYLNLKQMPNDKES